MNRSTGKCTCNEEDNSQYILISKSNMCEDLVKQYPKEKTENL
jgi:hypothetical protein